MFEIKSLSNVVRSSYGGNPISEQPVIFLIINNYGFIVNVLDILILCS